MNRPRSTTPRPVPASEWGRTVAGSYREEALLKDVLELCRHYRLYHIHFDTAKQKSGRWGTAQRGNAGFPDLVIIGPVGILFAELKSERGSLSEGQKQWRTAIETHTNDDGPVGYRLWRPRHLLSGEIAEDLKRLRTAA